ncbi:MAG: metallophosphoesterase family protein [Candidatus Hodarchaeales archaeon]
MKILLCADLEGRFSRLFQLVKYLDPETICICCGDIFDYHHPPDKDFKFPLRFFSVKGNKELWGGEKFLQDLADVPNFFWLNDHLDLIFHLTGLHFFGIDHMHEPKSIPKTTEVLISHRPAFGLADKCKNPRSSEMFNHCGSKAVRSIIDSFSPHLFVAGHIHHFQTQKTDKTLAITLPPSLSPPIVVIEEKKIFIDSQELALPSGNFSS